MHRSINKVMLFLITALPMAQAATAQEQPAGRSSMLQHRDQRRPADLIRMLKPRNEQMTDASNLFIRGKSVKLGSGSGSGISAGWYSAAAC